MLVPVQYQRLMARPTSTLRPVGFRMKFCTSAPFRAELKAEVLRAGPAG
jgi:long-chain acyl-CoA synthetase